MLSRVHDDGCGESIPPLGNWADPVKNVKAAIVWLKVNSGVLIDPKRVAIFGYSAGGYFSSIVSSTAGVASLEDFTRAVYSQNPQGFTSSVQASMIFNGPSNMSLFGALTTQSSPYSNSRIASTPAPSLAQTSTNPNLNGGSLWYGELFLNALGNASPFQIPNPTATSGPVFAGPISAAANQIVTAADPSTYITQNAAAGTHLIPTFIYHGLVDPTVPFSMADNLTSTINTSYSLTCIQFSTMPTGGSCNTITGGLSFSNAQPCTYVRDPTGNHSGAFSLIGVQDYANFLVTFLP